MKIYPGKRAKNYTEATTLVWHEAGIKDMSIEVTNLFISLTDTNKLRQETEKIIGNAVRNRYRGKPSWHSRQWYLPVPQLRFDSREIPRLIIEVPIHLVAIVEIETDDDYFTVTLTETEGKPKTLVIPMIFLQALLDDDLAYFRILARSSKATTWEIPGMNPLEMPDGFLNQLTKVLSRKPVVDWLHDFGAQGRSISPLVAGTLLGLMFANTAQLVPVAQQEWSVEKLTGIAEGMAYKRHEAKEMVNRALPYLHPEQTLEEATRILLQQAGRGG
jgi:hypothetical protein